jgi:citrate lyase subunit beta/citryl-CoA lyase
VHRSYLFAPGNHPRHAEKVFQSGADAAILDLEDAVALAEKPAARGPVAAALARPRSCAGYVRVNALSTPFARDDIAAVVVRGLDGLLLPKCESVAELEEAHALIGVQEARHGLARGSVELLPVIESARALTHLDAIAEAARRAGRIKRLSFGAADLALDLGMTVSEDEAELDYVRHRLVVASRAAELEAPVDTVWLRLQDIAGFRARAEKSRRGGFFGKLLIHPGQVSPANEVFTPSEAEIERARNVLEAFGAAEAQGLAAIQVDGQMVDYPVVHRARRTLSVAASIRARSRA